MRKRIRQRGEKCPPDRSRVLRLIARLRNAGAEGLDLSSREKLEEACRWLRLSWRKIDKRLAAMIDEFDYGHAIYRDPSRRVYYHRDKAPKGACWNGIATTRRNGNASRTAALRGLNQYRETGAL